MSTTLDVEVHAKVSRSVRARQLEGSFDVPAAEGHRLRWRVDLPLDERPWQVGLIVGPSGCGKSTLLGRVWGAPAELEWRGAGVIDGVPVDEIAAVCSAVGFNTIPAWLRPYGVLSNGEKFRVELARRLIASTPDEPIVLDEFTSVVDRQVARIGSHAVQKWVRRNGRQMVAATCHYDVEDWLQPDWVLEPRPSHLDSSPDASTFRWRSVQPRPGVQVEITPATYEAWSLFAPYHYLTASLNRVAKCYVLWARADDEHDWQPAAFAGIMLRPLAKRIQRPGVKPVWGVSRVVTLPDWQGLGLAFVLTDTLGAAYRAAGCNLHNYPAHPAYIRSMDRSPNWLLVARPEMRTTQRGPKSSVGDSWRPGGRPNAVFRYVGPKMTDRRDALMLFRCGR